MSKKYGDFSLDEIREINFSVGCILQDKKDLRPTAQKHLENIFNKTFSRHAKQYRKTKAMKNRNIAN